MIRRLTVLSLVALIAACGPQIEDNASSAGGDPTPTPEPTPTPGSTGKPATLAQGLQRFGDCMQYLTFETVGMSDVAKQSAESEAGGGQCYSCHESGTGGALLSIDPVKFFEENRSMPFVIKLVLGTVDDGGAFDDLVPAWRFRDKGLDPAHPEYILTEERELALQQFVQFTLDRYHQYDLDCLAEPPPETQ